MTPKDEVTEEMLSKIDEAAKAATPGPWLRCHAFDEPNAIASASEPDMNILGLSNDGMAVFIEDADAAYASLMSPDVALALVAKLRIYKRALEMACAGLTIEVDLTVDELVENFTDAARKESR